MAAGTHTPESIITEIQRYATAKYPGLELTESTLATLAWRIPPQPTTPLAALSSETAAPSYSLHFEHRRALNRLHNLKLILAGDYDTFTRTQTDKLSKDNFAQLKRLLDSIPQVNKLLTAAICIMAVPLSDEAKKRIGELPTEAKADAVAFMHHTLQSNAKIYPVCAELDDTQIRSLQIAFLGNSHLRHMIFAEGDNFMYQELITDKFDPANLAIWVTRWLIDITGLTVETNDSKDPKGSQSLTNNTFNDAWFIWENLNKPNQAELFLEHKAEEFGFTDLEKAPRLIATRLALLLNCPKDQLENLKNFIKEAATKADFIENFKAFSSEGITKTAIHGPALLRNLFNKAKDLKQTLSLAIPIYKKAWELYATTDQAAALSFFSIAQPTQLEKIINGSLKIENLALNEKMELTEQASPMAFAAAGGAGGDAAAAAAGGGSSTPTPAR